MNDRMREIVRMLGIRPESRGLMYVSQVGRKQINIEDLNDDQCQLIIDAWESRNYIPLKMFRSMCVLEKTVKPDHVKGESNDAYSRRYAKNIINFLLM